MTEKYLFPLTSIRSDISIGAKAQQIRWLAAHGYQVPHSFVLPFEAEAAYKIDARAFARQLRQELASDLSPTGRYAVRSSANVEDQAAHSFAGQFETVLDLEGPEAVLEAVCRVYESVERAPAKTYLERVEAEVDRIQMAVVIQEMIDARVAGVAFSKNPITGLNEVIVEAVEGSGIELVQAGKTPDRWAARWGGLIQQPESTRIDRALILKVIKQTEEIAEDFGAPVDLEWVYGAEGIFWVQVRPITTTAEITIYSNRIAREVPPGLIKPLVWSINTPLVNRAWIDLFTELIGPHPIRPEDLARAFYFRAYFNMGVIGQIFELLGFPPESLELLLGLEGGADRPAFKPTRKTYRHLPRMLRFLIDKLRFHRAVEQELPKLKQAYTRFEKFDLAHSAYEDILRKVEELIDVTQRAAYLNIVVPLLMSVYNAALKRQLSDLGVDYAKFDLMAGMEELAAYEPTVHLAALNSRFLGLDEPLQKRALASRPENWTKEPDLAALARDFHSFLDKFGHLSDSGNDFSSQPWREDHEFVLKMIANFSPPETRGKKLTFEDLPLKSGQKILVRWIYQQARQYRYQREAVSSLYTAGYGLFRPYFLAAGENLAARGLLDKAEDIFFLTFEEIKEPDLAAGDRDHFRKAVALRMRELEAAADIQLPELIYGDQAPPPRAAGSLSTLLTGIASSRGYYAGPVTVIQSMQEFDRLNPGDVLVIPYSDVSWTPLFGKAGAVIAESGGLLSHSSIVAREFNIPCVVSVEGACKLPEKIEVAVDGYRGEITVLPAEGD